MSPNPVDQFKAAVLANWWSYDIADPVGLYHLVPAVMLCYVMYFVSTTGQEVMS